MVAMWTGAALVAVVQCVTCWWIVRRLRSVERIEERLSNLCSALSLLTDTTESGLRDALSEMERLSRGAAATAPRQRAAVQRRIKTAARRGHSAHDIAVTEGVAEGEIRLRLGLDEAPFRLGLDARSPSEDRSHAAVR